jgi:hypothetical protein
MSLTKRWPGRCNIMRCGLLLLALVWLAGCQFSITPEKAGSVDLSKHGILVLAVRQEGDPEDVKQVRVEYYLRGQTPGAPSPFVDSSQELWVLAVPPGRYTIFGRGGRGSTPIVTRQLQLDVHQPAYGSLQEWSIVTGSEKRTSSDHPYTFSVTAGRITYGGSIENGVGRDRDRFGRPKYPPQVRDRRQEDMAAFRLAYPTWSALEVDFQVIDGFEWREVEDTLAEVPAL